MHSAFSTVYHTSIPLFIVKNISYVILETEALYMKYHGTNISNEECELHTVDAFPCMNFPIDFGLCFIRVTSLPFQAGVNGYICDFLGTSLVSE